MHPSTGMCKFLYTYFSFPPFLDVFKNYLLRKEQENLRIYHSCYV